MGEHGRGPIRGCMLSSTMTSSQGELRRLFGLTFLATTELKKGPKNILISVTVPLI